MPFVVKIKTSISNLNSSKTIICENLCNLCRFSFPKSQIPNLKSSILNPQTQIPRDKKKPKDCFPIPDRMESRFFIGKEGWREHGLKEAESRDSKKNNINFNINFNLTHKSQIKNPPIHKPNSSHPSEGLGEELLNVHIHIHIHTRT